MPMQGRLSPQQPWRNPSPLDSLLFAPLVFLSLFFPPLSRGSGSITPGKIFGITNARRRVLEYFRHKNQHLSQVFWLEVVSCFEFQVNVHAALWIDEVLYVIIWQKYPLSVGLSQHASAISSLIVAHWPLHYIIQNFKQFFPSPLKFQWRNVCHSTHRMDAPVRMPGGAWCTYWLTVKLSAAGSASLLYYKLVHGMCTVSSASVSVEIDYICRSVV